MKKSRKTALIISFILLALPFTHCQEKTITRNDLVIALDKEPATMDPRMAVDAVSWKVVQLLYNGLLKKDHSSRLVPDLAENWEMPDEKTYIFHLRKGVKFHDGTTLTARDVCYTFWSMMKPGSKSPRKGAYRQVEKVEALDDYTVMFKLKKPFSPFLINVAIGIVPERTAEKMGDDFGRHPVGTGPFELKRWVEGQRLELAAFEDHFDGPPKIKNLTIRIIPDDTTRYLELKKGKIDFLQNLLPPDTVQTLKPDGPFTVLKKEGTNYEYIGFNLRDPILSKRKVRVAIAHSLDIDSMIKYLMKGLATPATGLLYPGHWAYEPDVERYGYNPDLAEKLLNEAGFPRKKDGYRFAIEYKTTQRDLSVRKAEVIQNQLAKVGIKLKIVRLDWSAFFAAVRRGDFQMYSLQWVGITEPDIYYYVFHSDSFPPNGANRGHYYNPEVDRLIEEGRTTHDMDKRKKIYSKIQKIIARDLPYISLWYQVNVAVMKKGLGGYTLYPAGDFTALKEIRWLQPPEK